jgi:hypothetical protein
MKFLKRGKEAEDMTRQADAETERRRAAAQDKGPRIFRYWMPEGAEQQITFLDGEVNEQGVLDVPRYYEHNVFLGNSWKNWFPCTKDDGDACPLCVDKQPALVYVFTVIDHRQWNEKKGDHKSHENERKLFICKGDAYKRLSKIAHKRGGLTGITFDVSRIGDRSENVGSDFDFVEKQSLKKIAKEFGLSKKGDAGDNKVAAPYDYEEVLKYYSAEELIEMGVVIDESNSVGGDDVDEQKGKKKDKKSKKDKKDKKSKKDKKGKGKAPKESDYDGDL